MITNKELIENEVFRDIVRIRLNALAKMLEVTKMDRLPKIYEEGKRANFVSGGLVGEDSDRRPIQKGEYGSLTRSPSHHL